MSITNNGALDKSFVFRNAPAGYLTGKELELWLKPYPGAAGAPPLLQCSTVDGTLAVVDFQTLAWSVPTDSMKQLVAARYRFDVLEIIGRSPDRFVPLFGGSVNIRQGITEIA